MRHCKLIEPTLRIQNRIQKNAKKTEQTKKLAMDILYFFLALFGNPCFYPYYSVLFITFNDFLSIIFPRCLFGVAIEFLIFVCICFVKKIQKKLLL